MFGLHTADCRVSGISAVKGFGVLHDHSLDSKFFMWLVRIQTEHKPRDVDR